HLLGFLAEARDDRLVGRVLRQHRLQRPDAAHRADLLADLVDDPHAPEADDLDDLVLAADFGAGRENRGCGHQSGAQRTAIAVALSLPPARFAASTNSRQTAVGSAWCARRISR